MYQKNTSGMFVSVHVSSSFPSTTLANNILTPSLIYIYTYIPSEVNSNKFTIKLHSNSHCNLLAWFAIMVSKVMQMALVMAVFMGMLSARVAAQTGCTTALMTLMPCLGYISGNSTVPAPTCCSALASVVQSNPRCLCTMLGSGAAPLGIQVNQTRALALPGACNIQTPPVSQCNEGPAAAPGTSTPSKDGQASATTPVAASPTASTGTKTGQTGESSGGSTASMSIPLLLTVVLATSFASASPVF